MLKMLIAVDGSAHALRAVEAAAKLAQHAVGLELVLLNVRDSPAYYGDLPPMDYESLDSQARARQDVLLQKALTDAQGLGLTAVTTKGVVGSPATEIVREADERGVDQIAMGTHGRGAVGSLFLGSVAQRVIHLSKVPVLLVK